MPPEIPWPLAKTKRCLPQAQDSARLRQASCLACLEEGPTGGRQTEPSSYTQVGTYGILEAWKISAEPSSPSSTGQGSHCGCSLLAVSLTLLGSWSGSRGLWFLQRPVLSSHLQVILPKPTTCSTPEELSVHGGGPSAALTRKCFSFPDTPRELPQVLCQSNVHSQTSLGLPPRVLLHKSSSSFTVPVNCVSGE